MKTMRLRCKCGANLDAPTSLIGKAAKCTSCGFAFTVPSGGEGPASEMVKSAIESPSTDSTCEQCGFGMASENVVCLQCGYHRELKRKLSDPDPSDPSAWLIVGLMLLTGGAVVGVGYLQDGLAGKTFLLLYWCLFLAAGLLVVLLRKTLFDSDVFNYFALGTLVLIGVMRIYFAITRKNYKFSFLLLGMIGVCIVFLAARSHSENSRCKPFEHPNGGLNVVSAAIMFGVVLAGLALVYFVPSVGNVVAKGRLSVPFFGGIIAFGFLAEGGSGSGGNRSGSSGYYHSSCGSSCGGGGGGGGGCGGGCGGCGG